MSLNGVTVLLKKSEKVENILKKRNFWKEVKQKKMYSKSLTVLLEKRQKVKNVFKECYGTSGKTAENWKMSSKSVTVLLEKNDDVKNVLGWGQ